MFVKLLSGDLITLDAHSIEEARQQLCDRLSKPHRHLRLIDPETGEEAENTKEMLYLLISCAPSGDTLFTEEWWDWKFSSNVYELFEPIGSTFRPKHSPEEFEELVRNNRYIFTEFSHRSNTTVRRKLLGFMICRVSPVFLIDYLPRLQKQHYNEERNCVHKLLCAAGTNMFNIERYSEDDVDESLYYLYKTIIPEFDLSVSIESIYKAIRMNLCRVFGYFLDRETVSEEMYIKLTIGLDRGNAKYRLQMIKHMINRGVCAEQLAHYALEKTENLLLEKE
jgi:hypothetical protein